MVAFACSRKKSLRLVRLAKGTAIRQAARMVNDGGGRVLKPTVYLPSQAIPKA
jgi:hypothetical protein